MYITGKRIFGRVKPNEVSGTRKLYGRVSDFNPTGLKSETQGSTSPNNPRQKRKNNVYNR